MSLENIRTLQLKAAKGEVLSPIEAEIVSLANNRNANAVIDGGVDFVMMGAGVSGTHSLLVALDSLQQRTRRPRVRPGKQMLPLQNQHGPQD